MKRLLQFCLLSLWVASASAASYNINLPSGMSLIANHLNHPGGNTLNNILPSPPDGTVFWQWSCSGWTAYTYDAISTAWMPNGLATLNPGEGAMINLPTAASFIFSGTPVTPVLPVTLPCGCNATNLLSRQTTNAPSTFQAVTGFPPTQGTSLTRVNGGVTTVYTYSGGVWAPSTPTLNLGESAFIYVPCTNATSCCPDTGGVKYVQYPDVNNGIDVNATFTPPDPFDGLPWVLADDFPCTSSGPITDIHLWGSWLYDNVDTTAAFTLAIWSDVPANTNTSGTSYSYPGQLLWTQTYGNGQYTVCPYTNGLENFYDGDDAVFGGSTLLGSSSNLLYLCFDASPSNTFYQTGTPTAPTNYWLSVTVQSATGNRYFGWKSSATAYNDAAVSAFNGNFYPLPGDWYPMSDSLGLALNMAFKITTLTNTCVPPTVSGPNSVTNCVGTTATFTAVASGTGPFTYQWTKNGLPIAGAASSIFSQSVSGAGDAGTYCVIVANSCGAVTNCATLQLCPSNTVAQKWLQVPDTTPNGIDVRVTDQTMLADDFPCTASGPISEVRIWGSWLNDVMYSNACFCVGLWTDIPTNSGVLYSQPGQMLCETCFYPGQYTNFLYTNVYYEQFWDPFNPVPGLQDSQVWEYVFTMPTNSCWFQTNGNTYWLSLRIPQGCFDTYQYQFGWKTCPTNWNDDAVYGYYPGYGWTDLQRPPYYSNSLDLAFQIITPSNNIPVITNAPGQKWLQIPDATPNGIDVRVTDQTMLADDFRCDYTGPITEVRIWGSWLDDLVYTNPCFCLGLWTDIPTNGANPFSQPGQMLCETCFYPGQYTNFLYANVYWEQFWDPFTTTSGQQDSQVWEYVFTMPTNSCWWQTNGNTYWLSLRIPQGCFDTYQYQFGWKTCPTNWNDDAVYGYYPGNAWQDLQRPPDYTNSLDLAFQIITATNPCPPMIVTCPSDRTVSCGTIWSNIPPVVFDPCCGTNYTISFTTVSNGMCPTVLTLTWTVSDCAGYTTNCTQTVTIVDTNPPVITGVPAGGYLGCNPPLGALPTDAHMRALVTATDNCGLLATNITHVDGGAGCSSNRTFTITVMDACTNIATTNVVYTWTTDHTPPVITGLPAGGSLGCNPTSLPTDASVTAQVAATDNCGVSSTNVTHVDGNSGCTSNRTFTITVTDVCGNTATTNVTYTWTADTTPPTLTCSTNKTVLCGSTWSFDTPGVSDNCSTNVALTSQTSANGQCPQVITRIWTATDACGNVNTCTQTVTVVSCVPPPAGVALWLPFDETSGSSAANLYPGGNNGTLVNAPGHNLGSYVLNSLCFNGANQSVTVPDYPAINPGTGDFSIDAWVNRDPASGTTVRIVVDKRDVNSGIGYSLSVSFGNLIMTLTDSSGQTNYRDTGTVPTDNQWHFVAVTIIRTSTTGGRFYIDGVPTSTFDPTTHPGSLNNTNALSVAASPVSGNSPWLGCIDEVETFSRSLSASEVAGIYAAGPAGKCKSPKLACSNSKTVSCSPAWSFDLPTVVDPCCSNPVVTPFGNDVTNGTPCIQVITRTWLYVDCCGYSNFCSQTVTVTNVAPTITSWPASIYLGCNPVPLPTDGSVQAQVTTSGGCGVTTNVTHVDGGSGCSSNRTFTITASNACGSATVHVTYTWTADTIPPTLSCGTNKTVLCGSTWAFDTPAVSDNCSGTNVTLTSQTTTNGLCPQVITRIWTATDACGNASACTQTVTVVSCVPPPSSMVLWLPFDETSGTTAANLYPGGNSGTLFNGPVHNLGSYVNNSLCFDGVSSYVEVADYPALNVGTGDFSVDAWVKPTAVGSSVWIIVDHRAETGTNVVGYSFFLGTGNTLGFQIADGTFINYPSTLAVPADGLWHHVAVTVKRNDPQGIHFYLDGVVGSPGRDPTGHPGSLTPPPGYPFRVGSRSSSVSGLFPGCIDEVEVFTRELAGTEVEALFNAGAAGKCKSPKLACSASKTVPCGSAWSFNPPTVVDPCCTNPVVSINGSDVTNGTPCLPAITRTWLYVDCCGNSNFCSQTVTVSNSPPSITSFPIGLNLGCNPVSLPTDNSVLAAVTTSGGCGVTTNVTHVDAGSGCSTTRTFTITASNACGIAVVIATYTWTVDTTPPNISCFTNKTIPANTPWNFDTPTASDACCGTNVTIVIQSTVTSSICPQVITRTWHATDCCGNNSAPCSQTVTVLNGTPPSNDACSNAIPITVGSPAACGNTCCATPSPLGSIPTPCGASLNSPDVWYTYTPHCSGQVTIDTCGLCTGQTAGFDTVLSAYTGPCGSFTQVACNDDAGGGCGLQSRITFNAVANVTYHIRVAGWNGACGDFRLNLSATTNAPPNDLCANAIPVVAGSPAYCGTTVCATPSAPGSIPPPCGASANAPDVWFTYTAVCDGPITIDTCGLCTGQSSTYDTVLSAYTGPCNSLVQVACNDDAGGPCGLTSRITFNGTAGVTYHIRVAGYIAASGPFRLNITAPNLPPPNDDCANAIPVQIGSPAACGYTCCATPSPAGSIPVPCGASLNSKDVWYTWTPQCSGQATIDTCGLCPGQTTTFDTVLSVYWGQCGSFVTVACNDDALGTCGLQSRVTFFAVAGVTYHIRVAGYDTTPCGPFRLDINQALVPPPNDLCANAQVIGNGTYAFNTCGANTDGPNNSGCQPNHDVWFRYTPPCAGQVWVDTCNSSFDTVLAIYTGSCANLSLVACNDNATSGRCSGSQQSFVSFNALANVTYYIRVGGAGAAQGWGVLTLNGPYPALGTCPPASGPCYWRMFQVQGSANNTPWSWSIQVPCCANVGNTNVPGVPTGANANALAQAFVNSINNACPSGGIVAVALPNPFLTGLFVVCVKSCTNTPTPFVFRVGPAGAAPQDQCVVANVGGNIWPPDPLPTTGPCSFNPPIIELPYAGTDYNNNGVDDAIDIMTGTSADLNGNGIPDEAENCQVPQVLSKPDSQVVTLGTNATLSVTTSGTGPLSYQWSLNGLPLAGRTIAELTIPSVTSTDLGDYTLTVSNACGTLTVGPFTLSVESTEPVAPMIADAEFLKGNFQLTFSSKEGQTYVIEYKDHLDDPSWTPIATVVGDGTDQQIADVPPLPTMRFYRVRLTLP